MHGNAPLVQVYHNLSQLLNEENLNNLAPIFHRPIDQHTGINITGKFSTTDNTELGEMSYVTVMRNATTHLPHDGYGLAWRKQPEFLVDCANNGTGATTAHQLKFYETYGLTLNAAIAVVGSAAALKIPANGYLKYNVYLVDNDILQEEVWINYEQYWDQTGGKNQFLQAGKVWIEQNTWYQFRMNIHAKMGTDIWVWADGDSQGDAILTRGQTYPPYVPQAAGEHFGISIAQTRNNEWYYDSLEIWSEEEKFPMQEFKLTPDAEYFTSASAFTVNYYGVGYDPVDYVVDGNTGNSRTRAFVRNYSTGEWEYIGGHTATIDDIREDQLITKSFTPLSNYLDANGQVVIVAHAANSGPAPGYGYDYQTAAYVNPVTEWDYDREIYVPVTEDFSDNTNHTIRTYYVSLTNIDQSGVHKGNSVDIYCHDPSNIKYGTATGIIAGNNLYTLTFAGDIGGPIQEITGVKLHLSQTDFDEDAYYIESVAAGSEFSTEANYKINFASDDDLTGVEVDLVYKYWINGDNVQAFVQADDNRYPGMDYLVKTMPPHIVVINSLEYSGGLSENAMREKLLAYINEYTSTTLTKSGIIALLQNNGATYVDTTDIDIDIRAYSSTYIKTITALEDTYTISSTAVGKYYTDKTELLGLTQL